ncbi:CDP-alcohol phosphatidyltransferase family protein [Pseudonocardia sp. KRD291]|uniref:CDP-alcohol phosphatidyltransferase family protein n=1 Tax=Pseudonocardia sp. KRD291 TaxID=2792007 RepID=UPI001C49CDAA|nr:CDP-alcohol phosphatidyltransferase family protein [Pseudonocardia sp. KRD291]MBW0102450.1 CDP-alcohol phosphatidyltransferase family protein [Pseudonocardia sp. KRD291]
MAGLPELPPGQRDRVLTVPNALSALRLAGVPLFLWLMLGPQADAWAVVVLAVGGATDWLDGKLARVLGQYSRLGALLDPAVDRLYILAALVGLGLRDIIPWWVVAALIARDVVLAGCVLVLRSRGYGPFVVTYLGKAATFVLLYAFPLLLLGDGPSSAEFVVRVIAYGFAGWGVALYLWTGLLYLAQFVLALRRPLHPAAGGPADGAGADRPAGPTPSGRPGGEG